jgi:uncharacterized membrane protein
MVWIPEHMGSLFYDIGHALVQDDRHDIMQFGRLHHWQCGAFMMMLGRICNMVDEAKTKYASNPELLGLDLKPKPHYLKTR